MAEPGPQHDGPRPPTPRPRGERRDPVALAAWRRVAEQRRRAVDGAGSAADEDPVSSLPDVSAPGASGAAGSPGPASPGDRVVAVEAPVVEAPVVEAPAAEQTADAAPDPTGGAVADGAADAEDLPSVRIAADDAADGGPVVSGTPASADRHGESAPVTTGPGDGSPGRLHDVLLGLAGRLDDDALTSVREMVAAEDDAEAAELLGGCLLAGGVGLTAGERAVLRPWFAAARVDAELLDLVPTDTAAPDRSVHRFVATAGDRAAGLPLARAARRLPGVLAVRESWRVTPAGSAPGPVPHRVVLVETEGPDDYDHVVHHLVHAARTLDDTSVEVFAAGAALPAYHRDALASARPLVAAEGAPSPPPAAEHPDTAEREAPRSPSVDEETWRTVADAGRARPIASPPTGPRRQDADESDDAGDPAPAPTLPAPEPAAPVADVVPATADEPADTDRSVPAETPPETSIDDDLSSTARRIAALWAQPSPEDFSAPLPAESLEPTRLEPAGGDLVDPVPEDTPSGRHGRAPAYDPGTTSFRSPRPRARTNGHRLPPADEPGDLAGPAGIAPDPDASDPAVSDPDGAQVRRTRQSRAPEVDGHSPRFGHDARFGAGAGPAWPGGPVAGDSGPGPDTLFTSPVEVGEEPVVFGIDGHRGGPGHRHDPVPPAPDDEPATGPVAWSGPGAGGAAAPPAGPHVISPPPAGPAAGPSAAGPTGVPGPPAPGRPGPRRPGEPAEDVAPPWAPADGGGWTSRPPGSQPPGRPPAADGEPGRSAEPEAPASWSPDFDDSVAQLSDRERELLARLHEELAQRERAEGPDPFAGPPRRGSGPQPPQQPPGSHPPRPSPPHGRLNGHGLPPERPDDAG